MEAPRLFISYSWSNPFHEQWVLDLATELVEYGVDVVLDKWDLKEGYDAIAFMEKMVNDPEIRKVAIVTDEIYVAKADGRLGGVGTETQIISKEVYEKQAQDKFMVVVAQKDEDGKPYLPTYYKSRIYIDLSEPDNYADNFEKLLRWIFDKPLHKKPEIGKRPAFLSDSEPISLGTTAIFKRAIDAMKNAKPYSAGVLDEYLNNFAENLERFRIQKTDEEFDETVVKNIEAFLPYRNELIQLLIIIAQYAPNDESIRKLHRFFESLIPYMNPPLHTTVFRKWDCDNFIFIIHELLLYTISILIKYECFEGANYLLEQKYYLPGSSEYGRDTLVNFLIFRKYIESLEYRNKRLKLGRISVRADLLNERNSGTGIEFRHLMQADFVLFMRAEIEAEDDWGWWPETLVYLGHFHSTFEIFSRGVSKKYFDRMKCLLSISSPKDLESLLKSYSENRRKLPRWGFTSVNPIILLGYEKLASQP